MTAKTIKIFYVSFMQKNVKILLINLLIFVIFILKGTNSFVLLLEVLLHCMTEISKTIYIERVRQCSTSNASL